MSKIIIKRLLEPHLQRLAQQYPVITLTGPRQSGKTTICKKVFSNYDYVNLEDLDVRQYAQQDPRGFLDQYNEGVILDEIQRTPDLPSYIQGIVDEKQEPGLFILTGSQQFAVSNVINQSLAGRTALLTLLPLAFTELNKKTPVPLAQLLFSGFYPRIHAQALDPHEALSFYLATYIERDLRQLTALKDLSTFERFLRICATQVGSLLNYSRLASDCGIDQKTVKSWLSLLEASYIIFQLSPHHNNFRKRITKSKKLYFYDVGLAAYLLGINQAIQINQHPLKGALFENFIISEFLKNCYNQVKQNNLYFFRDHMGNEVDLILDYGDQLLSVEIKSGATIATDFFKGLNYYHQLSAERNSKRYLVYTGTKKQVRQNVAIYPYTQVGQLFGDLL